MQKILVVTNLFPNSREPNRSTFNFQQFAALARLCELKVVAPVPYFQYSATQLPYVEKIARIDVYHPRYLVIPKVLRFTYGVAFFVGIWHTLKAVYSSFKYDVILAAWAYPDAFGAAIAARLLKKKLFIKVQGSDINLAHQYWLRPTMIKWALSQADKIIAVSRPLKEKMIAMGVPEAKIVVIQNGVDTKRFYPRPKDECRLKLGLDKEKRYVLFVGNFAPVKGVSYLIKALAALGGKDVHLVLIGDGEDSASLKSMVHDLGLDQRVVFAGRKPHDEIPLWMSAADVFCLPSLNEGCPNVVLEAMACGAKVVASNVGGVPDLIDSPEKGWLARPRDAQDLARCLKQALNATSSGTTTRMISWEDNAALLFNAISG